MRTMSFRPSVLGLAVCALVAAVWIGQNALDAQQAAARPQPRARAAVAAGQPSRAAARRGAP